MIKQKLLIAALILFIVFDLSWTFVEYYDQPFQGDIIPLVLPDKRNAPILSDPFGIKAISTGTYHPNPNRFFCCISLYYYLRKAPIFLQNFVHPVESLYLSAAFFKFSLFLGFLFLLVKITMAGEDQKKNYLIATIIILPLLQTGGVFTSIALLETSIVYIFFYSFPLLLLALLGYGLVINKDKSAKAIPHFSWKISLLYLLGLVCSFSSAFAPPVILLCAALYFAYKFLPLIFRDQKLTMTKIFKSLDWKFYLISYLCLLGVYSFYLGSLNPESVDHPSLSEKYANLWSGILRYFVKEPGLTILWLLAGVNFSLLKFIKIRIPHSSALNFALPFFLFSILYISMLPLGGFRAYRPEILRGDILLPVTFMSLILFTSSSYLLVQRLTDNKRNYYAAFLLIIFVVFSHYDYAKRSKGKDCEEATLYKISQAQEKIIDVESCAVMAWWAIKKPKFYTNHSKLWKYWNISEEQVLIRMKK